MKEITAILILLTLLTSCGEQRKTAENTAAETSDITAETSTIGEISSEVTTTCSDMISPITTTAEITEIPPKTTESQTTVTVSENAEEKRSDDSEETAESAQTTAEIPPKTTESQTTVTVSENTKEKESVDSVTTAGRQKQKPRKFPIYRRKPTIKKRGRFTVICVKTAAETV